MAVNLSPVAGAAAQFFDNSGNVLTGGKLYTYDAGTTTPAPSYTTSTGTTAHPNPIILNAAGRVPDSGEIWLTDGVSYKFVLKDQNDVLIATYDNLIGINSNFVNFTGEEEQQTATQGQTVFTLATLQYQPTTNNLLVFVNGSKQIESTNYIETSSTTVTFVDGLNVGDVVDFCTATPINTSVITAAQVSYNEGSANAVNTTVEAKLQETVSVKDFGAIGDGTTDDTVAIQNTFNYARDNSAAIWFPQATYRIDSAITFQRTDANGHEQFVIYGDGSTLDFSNTVSTSGALFTIGAISQATGHDTGSIYVENLRIIGPELGSPFAGDTPTTSLIGLHLYYALNVTLNNIYVEACYTGVKTNFVFPLRAKSVDLKANYIGLYLDDDSTVSTWDGFSVTSARYGIVAKPTSSAKIVSDQYFSAPRIENCLVGVVLDPSDVGGGSGCRSIVFQSPYLESITYDYFRIGLSWTFANPATRNANAVRDVIWCQVNLGMWDGVAWTATKAPIVVSSTSTVISCQFLIPAAKSNAIGDFSNSVYRSYYDSYIGATSPIVEYDNAQIIRDNQPAFSAYVAAQADNVTGDGTEYTVIGFTEDFDSGGNNFNRLNGVYTAALTGKYIFIANIFLGGVTSGHTSGFLKIVTSLKTIVIPFNPFAISNGGEVSWSLQSICQMVTGDTATMTVTVSGSTKVVDVKPDYTTFANYFLG